MSVFKLKQLTKRVILVFIILGSLSGCGNPDSDVGDILPGTEKPSDSRGNNLSGTWLLHTLDQDKDTFEHIDLYSLVNLTDTGSQLIIDSCIPQQKMYLTRVENELVTNEGTSLRIVDENKLSSRSIAHIVNLEKQNASHLQTRGSFQFNANNTALPNIENTRNICVQQTVYEDPDSIALQIAVPYGSNYLHMQLNVQDINETPFNIESMTFQSPVFGQIKNQWMIETLHGNVTLHSFEENHIKLDFEVTTASFSGLEDENFSGSLDVEFILPNSQNTQ